MLNILFWCCIGAFSVLLLYYLIIFTQFVFAKPNTLPKTNSPVSVLICAKNEAQNITKILQAFAAQNYSNFELVLINDRSTDDTLELMEAFKKANPTLDINIVNVQDIEQFWGNKKYALTLGIKASKHEHLLFTDADCTPKSDQWIQEIANAFTPKKQLILGYGAYQKNNGFLNKIIRYETLLTALQYFSFAKIGLPYMGVGRNIAYTKSLFFSKNGFANHLNIRSGDDDLFVNENATKSNVSIVFSSEAHTSSIPKQTFKEWIQQKRRHISTAKHYKGIHQFLLALFYIAKVVFWITSIVLLAFLHQWEIITAILVSYVLVHTFIIAKTAKKLDETGIAIFAPFLELFLILLQMLIFIKNLFQKPTHW